MIISFYSYKGGVGRTQLVANLAAYLYYYKKKKVLLMDWDIEAPGLDYFFKINRNKVKSGLLEHFIKYVESVKNHSEKTIEFSNLLTDEYIISINKDRKQDAKLDFIAAGKYGDEYNNIITNFDWVEFYDTYQGKYYIEHLKNNFMKQMNMIIY